MRNYYHLGQNYELCLYINILSYFMYLFTNRIQIMFEFEKEFFTV